MNPNDVYVCGGHAMKVDRRDLRKMTQRRWSLSNAKYAVTWLSRSEGERVEYAHRMILGLVPGDGKVSDHINGDRLDNRRCNLRVVDKSQNGSNVGKHKDNRSGFKGVRFHKQSGRWQARISTKKGNKNLGLFASAEKAATVYDQAALDLHGKFAKVNFPHKIIKVCR